MKRPQERTFARRAGVLLGAAALLLSFNFASAAPVETTAQGVSHLDRYPTSSRSGNDRPAVQPGVTVAAGSQPFIHLSTAHAELEEPPPGGPTCIASPLVPGTFRISSNYGMRYNPITGAYGLHAGVDLAAPMGTPIHAVADGVVKYTGQGRAGRSPELIIIDHEVDGKKFSSWYNHMYPHGVFVEAGQEVRAGEVIGEVGSNGFSTGPHLHLEIHTPLTGGGTGTALGMLFTTVISPGEEDATPAPEQTPSPMHSLGTDEPVNAEETLITEEAVAGQEAAEGSEDDGQEHAEDGPAGENPGENESPEIGSETDPDTSQEDTESADAEAVEAPVSPEGTDDTAAGESDPTEEVQEVEDVEEGLPEDFVIEEDDDEGKNDHTIEDTVSRTTGIFDPSSLGVLHDPLLFLRALGYGLAAPATCFDA